MSSPFATSERGRPALRSRRRLRSRLTRFRFTTSTTRFAIFRLQELALKRYFAERSEPIAIGVCPTVNGTNILPVARHHVRCVQMTFQTGIDNPNFRHGHGANGKVSAIYNSWVSMKRRCLRPNREHYADYGGRGIKFAERWMQFENFLADILAEIGPRQKGKTLDRKHNDGNYEPGNVRWSTPKEQANNRRKARPRTPEQLAVLRAMLIERNRSPKMRAARRPGRSNNLRGKNGQWVRHL